MTATKTELTTRDGLRVYDLCPNVPALWAVVGPDGVDPATIDADDLPDGFRWVEDDEWSNMVFAPRSKECPQRP